MRGKNSKEDIYSKIIRLEAFFYLIIFLKKVMPEITFQINSLNKAGEEKISLDILMLLFK